MTERQGEVFRRLFAAASAQPPTDEPHFVDDDELLDRWTNDQINAVEHEAILSHLDKCDYCSSVLSDFLRHQVLELPDVSGEDERESEVENRGTQTGSDAPTLKQTDTIVAERRSRRRWALAVAAGLIGVAGFVFVSNYRSDELAAVELALSQNRPEEAINKLEQLQSQGAVDEARARELAERAGLALSEAELVTAQYSEVQRTVDRVARLGADSPRLANNALQAARKMPAVSALSRNGALLDYQYNLQGNSLGKALPVFDDQTQLLLDRFSEATTEHNRDAGLRLNYGQYLLTLGRADEALEQFETARQLEPQNPQVFLGLGLVAFEKQEFERATEYFVRATELDPANFSAHLNAAICLDRTNNSERAASHWRRAEELAPDENLRANISAHRQR